MLFNVTTAFRRVTDISPEMLHKMGIRGLILDIDNTLAGHNNPVPAEGVSEWLECMKSHGIRLVIMSNNFRLRVELFAKLVGLEYISDSKKPFKKGYRRAAMKMGLPKHAMAAVGDQMFTDVLGANLFNIKMLYTMPIGGKKSRLLKFRRLIEYPLIPKRIYCGGGKYIERRNVKAITYSE